MGEKVSGLASLSVESNWTDIVSHMGDLEALTTVTALDPTAHKGGWLRNPSGIHGPRGTVWMRQYGWSAPSEKNRKLKVPSHRRIAAQLLTKDAAGPFLHRLDIAYQLDSVEEGAWLTVSRVRPVIDEKGGAWWHQDYAEATVLTPDKEFRALKVIRNRQYEKVFATMIDSMPPNATTEEVQLNLVALINPNIPLPEAA